ncbi:MAG: type IX secretion system membrane protein PorP/SprF [Flavobacteriales bacterium]|nr:type IX secretion system membrane protein PorP/SprF [Flavobacteriales bacterium]
MKKGIVIISLVLFCSVIFAQQVPITSQYMMNRLVINPAYAGALDFYTASISYRKQWINLDGAPSTQNISIHGPALKGKIGLGLMFFRDVIGVSKENNISASFAYKIRSRNKKVLSFGLSGSAVFSNNQWSQIKTTNADDAVFSADSPQYIFPDFSAGVYYKTPRYFAGFSIPMFLQHKLEGSSSSYKIENDFSNYNYLLEAGLNINITDKIIFKPSFLSRYLPSTVYQFDINAVVDINNTIGFGISYRTKDAIVGMVQLHLTDQLILGYSYDHTLSQLQKYNNGSHEVFLRYDFRYKVKSIDPRFF